jgi:peptide/nickel transport system substrate-binding protein
MIKHFFLFLLIIAALICNAHAQSEIFAKPIVIALTERISGLDTLTNTGTDAAADRVRTLIYNSLVKKNEKFEYVGDLSDYKIGDDNLTVTFTLKDNIKFHNDKVLTSADVKYTFDALFQANGSKAGSFYDSVPDKANSGRTKRVAHIESIKTPDAKTVIFKVTRPELVNQLLSNLVTIPIIPEGTIEQQKTAPIGTGAFKFISFDQLNYLVQLQANTDYWEAAPKITKLNVKTVPDANALQNELLSGEVDIVLNPTTFSPDILKSLNQSPNLTVEQFSGSNIQYIGFNTKVSPFNKVKVRQAVAYAIDREKIVKNILAGQTKVADSILPEESWAYSAGIKYTYNPAKAKQLLKEAGYKGKVIKFIYVSGNQTVNQYSQVIQSMLKDVGLNVEVEALEPQTHLENLKNGQFQMNTSIWVGGNQDPIFYQDLFASGNSPDKKLNGRNRARYSNLEFDKVIEKAVNTINQTQAKMLYAKAQEIISNDVPLFPLWYPSNIVVSNKRIKNTNMKNSTDWSFVKYLELSN